MKYHVLAADYDGTLATHGDVDDATLDALKRVKESGRRLILVTGRTLAPLLQVFPQIGIFDLVVAENGALLYDPDTQEERLLGEPPPAKFADSLVAHGVPPLEIGRVIVATWTPHESAVLEVIRQLGLELQIIFNKGAVMVLPTGINKATGLHAALLQLGYSRHNVVGVGDAENDEAFLRLCGASAAVGNALDPVKSRADIVLRGERGAGVVELVEQLLDNDLVSMHHRPESGILLGTDPFGRELRAPVYGSRILVTGDPAGGKSKFAVGVLEQLFDEEYQICVIDPEGDYQQLENAIVLGTRDKIPTTEEVLQVVSQPDQSCVISLFGIDAEEQPEEFDRLLRGLMDHRSKTGRPHWYLIDEAHYPLPAKWQPLEELHLDEFGSVMYVTAFPDRLPQVVLRNVDMVVAIGEQPPDSLATYAAAIGAAAPKIDVRPDPECNALVWRRDQASAEWLWLPPPRGEHRRHQHSHWDGEMEPQFRFYFRGPDGELNLPAENLKSFMQLGNGVDDETWLFHLQRGDYADWLRNVVRDEQLAELADRLAASNPPSAQTSRAELFDLISKKYEHAA